MTFKPGDLLVIKRDYTKSATALISASVGDSDNRTVKLISLPENTIYRVVEHLRTQCNVLLVPAAPGYTTYGSSHVEPHHLVRYRPHLLRRRK